MKKLIQTLFFFLLVTQICFAQWEPIGLSDKSISDIEITDSHIFVITSVDRALFIGQWLDGGYTWVKIVDSNVIDIATTSSNKLFMIREISELESNLYFSIDNGNIWTQINIQEQLYDSLDWCKPTTITVSPSGILFCGLVYCNHYPRCSYDVLSFSTDNGSSWNIPGQIFPGGRTFDFKKEFVVTTGNEYLGTYFGNFIFMSSDYGNTWNRLNQPIFFIGFGLGFFSNNNLILAGRECYPCLWGKIFLTADMGNTWAQISSLLVNTGLKLRSDSLERILFGTTSGVFLFSDEGDSLGSRNEGLTNLNIRTLTIDNNNYVYAGTGNGIWKRTLSEIVTSIKEISANFPSEYLLYQNYPNPFNPSTMIKYSIPKQSLVTLKVYDILGNKIADLVNEEKSWVFMKRTGMQQTYQAEFISIN